MAWRHGKRLAAITSAVNELGSGVSKRAQAFHRRREEILRRVQSLQEELWPADVDVIEMERASERLGEVKAILMGAAQQVEEVLAVLDTLEQASKQAGLGEGDSVGRQVGQWRVQAETLLARATTVSAAEDAREAASQLRARIEGCRLLVELLSKLGRGLRSAEARPDLQLGVEGVELRASLSRWRLEAFQPSPPEDLQERLGERLAWLGEVLARPPAPEPAGLMGARDAIERAREWLIVSGSTMEGARRAEAEIQRAEQILDELRWTRGARDPTRVAELHREASALADRLRDEARALAEARRRRFDRRALVFQAACGASADLESRRVALRAEHSLEDPMSLRPFLEAATEAEAFFSATVRARQLELGDVVLRRLEALRRRAADLLVHRPSGRLAVELGAIEAELSYDGGPPEAEPALDLLELSAENDDRLSVLETQILEAVARRRVLWKDLSGQLELLSNQGARVRIPPQDLGPIRDTLGTVLEGPGPDPVLEDLSARLTGVERAWIATSKEEIRRVWMEVERLRLGLDPDDPNAAPLPQPSEAHPSVGPAAVADELLAWRARETALVAALTEQEATLEAQTARMEEQLRAVHVDPLRSEELRQHERLLDDLATHRWRLEEDVVRRLDLIRALLGEGRGLLERYIAPQRAYASRRARLVRRVEEMRASRLDTWHVELHDRLAALTYGLPEHADEPQRFEEQLSLADLLQERLHAHAVRRAAQELADAELRVRVGLRAPPSAAWREGAQRALRRLESVDSFELPDWPLRNQIHQLAAELGGRSHG